MKTLLRNGNSDQFPGFFDDLFNRNILNWGLSNFSNTNTTIPAVNIRETPERYEVELAAPGMEKKDFRIQLDDNVLTISSEKEHSENNGQKPRYALREFSYQSFSRTFTLQKDVVDTEKIEATYADGVLRLAIPKKQEAKEARTKQIMIS